VFRDNLKRLRKAAGFTQKRLGEIIGAGESTISEWESGKRAPDIERLPDIARALGDQPIELLDGDEASASVRTWDTPLVDAYAS